MIRDTLEKILQERNSNIQKKEEFLSIERIVILREMNMAAINAEIEALKIKIAYRRKLVIL
jgi:hypothetical protein